MTPLTGPQNRLSAILQHITWNLTADIISISPCWNMNHTWTPNYNESILANWKALCPGCCCSYRLLRTRWSCKLYLTVPLRLLHDTVCVTYCVCRFCVLLSPLEEISLSLPIESPHFSFTFTPVFCLMVYVDVFVCAALSPTEVCYCLYLLWTLQCLYMLSASFSN